MSFDLELFALGVQAKSATWSALSVVWQVTPIAPNHGKPVVAGTFESVAWLAEMTVWITGEAELAAGRLGDGWIVNKHYDLVSPDDLEIALGELASLVAGASVPGGAVTAWVTQQGQ
ncbi:MAG: hypothetical protein ACRDPY_38540 [Streptosporangiaceae bacterium]